MRNGSMFATLHRYADKDFLTQTDIFIYTLKKVLMFTRYSLHIPTATYIS